MTPREYLASGLRPAVKISDDSTTFNQEICLPQQYAYKIAYITDQKCVKPEITIYTNDLISGIQSGVKALQLAHKELNNAGFVAAPLGHVGEVMEK